MSRKLNRWGLALLASILVVSLGCGNADDERAAADAAAQEEAWSELQAQKAELDALRQELTDLRTAAAQPAADADAADAPAAGEAAAQPAAEDGQARVPQLESELQQESEELYQALVGFINAAGLVEGEEPSPQVREAIRMKSAEDMLVAEEYIDKGGNYRQAIDIYKSALSVDPENAELQQALAAAEANRYMSEERFAAATKGMTKEQVREVLGIPYHANVRTFPDDNVEAWFYPVNAAGSAAAVWFRQSGGEMKAYEVNFEEVVKEGPSVVGEEPEST
jgi:tetratricopeptide (TPR) repeat protein